MSDLARAHQLGKDLLFRINQKQVGNGIGTLLASMGIPLLIDAFKGGSGVRMGGPGSSGSGSPRIGMPPPYIGTWGRGKKKSGKGLILGKNSPFKNIPILWTIL